METKRGQTQTDLLWTSWITWQNLGFKHRIFCLVIKSIPAWDGHIPPPHADILQLSWMGLCRACWTWRQTRCRGWVWQWHPGRGRLGWFPCRTQSSPWSIILWGRCMEAASAARLKKTHKPNVSQMATSNKKTAKVCEVCCSQGISGLCYYYFHFYSPHNDIYAGTSLYLL